MKKTNNCHIAEHSFLRWSLEVRAGSRHTNIIYVLGMAWVDTAHIRRIKQQTNLICHSSGSKWLCEVRWQAAQCLAHFMRHKIAMKDWPDVAPLWRFEN